MAKPPGDSAPSPALVRVLERARSHGFLGAATIAQQISHARFLGAATPPGRRCVDLGSGGGLPALPVALDWPDSQWWLVESSERRAAFLQAAVTELGLVDRVEVLGAPAEEVGRGPLRETADRVLARSFGPPSVTAECAGPFLEIGGLVVVSEPPGSTGGRWDGMAETDLGLVLRSVAGGATATVAVLEKVAPTTDRYPRQAARRREAF